MKLSVNQKCILAFITGILACCIYKRYTSFNITGASAGCATCTGKSGSDSKQACAMCGATCGCGSVTDTLGNTVCAKCAAANQQLPSALVDRNNKGWF